MGLDGISIGILTVLGAFIAVGVVLWSIKRYEVAVLLMMISPWISAISLRTTDITLEELTPGPRSYIRVALLLFLGLIGILTFFKLRSKNRERIPAHFILLGGFILWAALSSAYSIDREYTLIRAVSFAALFAFLLGFYLWLCDSARLKSVGNVLFHFIFLATILNFASFFLLPSQAWGPMENRFRGLWGHPNEMGGFCMLAYPVCLWKHRLGPPLWRWIMAGTILTLAVMHFFTGSRATLVCGLFGVWLWFTVLKGKFKSLLFLGGIIVLGALIFSMLSARPSSFQRESEEGVSGLTGRPEFWHGALTLVLEKPWLGYGYGVEGKIWEDPRFNIPDFMLFSGSTRTSLHNGYFSVAIGMGLFGFFLWFSILFLPFWKIFFSPGQEARAFILAVMGMCLLLNFFETAITAGSSITAIFFWLAWAMAQGIFTENRKRVLLRYTQKNMEGVESNKRAAFAVLPK